MNAAATAAAFIVALAALSLSATSVDGHGGEMGLFLDRTTAWPGAVVGVRGDLPTTDPVDLVLVDAAGNEIPLARVEDPPNGHFDIQVTLPLDVLPGGWKVMARAPGMTPIGSRITIVSGPGAIADPAETPLAAGGPDGISDSPGDAGLDPAPILSLGLAIAALAMLLGRTRRRMGA